MTVLVEKKAKNIFKYTLLPGGLNVIQIAVSLDTPDMRQSKTLLLSTNVDQKWLETEFLIAICRPTGDK